MYRKFSTRIGSRRRTKPVILSFRVSQCTFVGVYWDSGVWRGFSSRPRDFFKELLLPFRRWFVVALCAVAGFSITAKRARALEPSGGDVHCHVLPAHEPSAAEKAFLDGNASQAESLYREALGKTPHDAALTAGLVRTLLHQQKVQDAASAITLELALAPNSVPLMTASAEVQYREGKIAEAFATVNQAFKIDPCNPRLYLISARIFRLNSMYASERRDIATAHALDPSDVDIRRIWSSTLPLSQRIDQQKQFLATANGMDEDERAKAEKVLSSLTRWASDSDKPCHVASNTSSTELPFVPIMSGGNSSHIQSWGLHVAFNGTETVLGVDTGASGLIINRAIAERAGLKPLGRVQLGGVGDQAPQGGYIAHVDSIRIGTLEFRDCTAEVTDRKDILTMDGLIGTDVFSNYLITLDFPMRKFLLSQLPPRPTDATGAVATLNTEAGDHGAGTTGAAGASAQPQDRYISPTMKDYVGFFRAGHEVLVPTRLNGKTERLFLVDTGAFSSSISPDTAREVTKVHGNSPGTIRGLSGDVAKVSFGEAVLFQFGGIQQQNNDLYSFDISNLSRGAGLEISGFLGSTVLRQLTISIDYRDGLIKFDYDPRHGNHNF
jgi:predicted aspartyl protease